MITRINFFERKRFEVTYGVILGALGGILLFCFLIYGFLWLNSTRAEAKIHSLQTDIERLKKEREQIIHQQSTLQGEGAVIQIQQILEKNPSWSVVLNAITEALPPRVWLASLKSASKAVNPPTKELILNGQAKGAQIIAIFLSNLQRSPTFAKVTLTTSTEETNGMFQFTIACDIGSNPWNLESKQSQGNKSSP